MAHPEKLLHQFTPEQGEQEGRIFCSLAVIRDSTQSTAAHTYLTIGGQKFKVLIDSGASISLLSSEVLQLIGRTIQEADTLPAMTVDRSLADMQGLVKDV